MGVGCEEEDVVFYLSIGTEIRFSFNLSALGDFITLHQGHLTRRARQSIQPTRFLYPSRTVDNRYWNRQLLACQSPIL